MFQVNVTFTFDLLTPKSIVIIYRPWPTKTPIMASLSLIGFKLLSGQDFANTRRTDGQMDHMRHNIIQPKVSFGQKKDNNYKRKSLKVLK